MTAPRLPVNFGHRRRRNPGIKQKLVSIYTSILGVPNTFKRQQLPDMFEALDLRPSDTVLDFGCTSGYISIEMAKFAGHVQGLDIIALDLELPPALVDKFTYTKYSGDLDEIPLPNGSFDRILASEVLYVFEDFETVFRHLHRLLKDDGVLVVVNGIGRPVMRRAYERNSLTLRLFKLYPGTPRTFEDFEKGLQHEFRAAGPEFPTRGRIADALEASGFRVERNVLTPCDSVVRVCEWYQFVCKAFLGRALYTNNPIGFAFVHPVCALLRRISNGRTLEFGAIFVARKAPAGGVPAFDANNASQPEGEAGGEKSG